VTFTCYPAVWCRQASPSTLPWDEGLRSWSRANCPKCSSQSRQITEQPPGPVGVRDVVNYSAVEWRSWAVAIMVVEVHKYPVCCAGEGTMVRAWELRHSWEAG